MYMAINTLTEQGINIKDLVLPQESKPQSFNLQREIDSYDWAVIASDVDYEIIIMDDIYVLDDAPIIFLSNQKLREAYSRNRASIIDKVKRSMQLEENDPLYPGISTFFDLKLIYPDIDTSEFIDDDNKQDFLTQIKTNHNRIKNSRPASPLYSDFARSLVKLKTLYPDEDLPVPVDDALWELFSSDCSLL